MPHAAAGTVHVTAVVAPGGPVKILRLTFDGLAAVWVRCWPSQPCRPGLLASVPPTTVRVASIAAPGRTSQTPPTVGFCG